MLTNRQATLTMGSGSTALPAQKAAPETGQSTDLTPRALHFAPHAAGMTEPVPGPWTDLATSAPSHPACLTVTSVAPASAGRRLART